MIEGTALLQATAGIEGIEDVLLTHMWEQAVGSDWGPTGCAFNFRSFDPLPRDVVRGVLRNLRDKGMVEHMNALWSEDGEPRGAGYALTAKAAAAFRKKEENLEKFRHMTRELNAIERGL